MARRRIVVSGRVQGVGFRYTSQAGAGRFAVAGFVQNLPDGRVRLVAEGTATELDRFLEAVRAALGRHIDTVEQKTGPATGEFRGFSIRH